MGNWIPGDPTLVAQLLKISGSYAPPPPEGFISPVLWGDVATVTERFGAAGITPEQITTDRRLCRFVSDGPPASVLGRLPRLLRPDDERVCRCCGERQDRRAAGRTGGAVQRAEHERRSRPDGDAGGLSAGGGLGLSGTGAEKTAQTLSRKLHGSG